MTEQNEKQSLVGEEYEVEVGPVAHGGHCIARTAEGRVLFVRHTLPGEKVVAKVTEGDVDSRFLRADAITVLDASKDRAPAPCPFAGPGKCGGCDWQHAKPGAQRRLKGEVVAEQLKRLAGLTPEEAGWDGTVMPAEGDKLPAGQVPQWRTRVQFAIDEDGNAGLRKHRSHDIELIDHCMIAAPGVSELGIEKQDWPQMASVEAIAASGSNDRQVVLTPARAAGSPSWSSTSRSRSCGSRRRTAVSTASTAAPSSASAPTAVRTASAWAASGRSTRRPRTP
ncbi:hypothetical protein GCM10020254_24790 [Streptomyces goshikiensis]